MFANRSRNISILIVVVLVLSALFSASLTTAAQEEPQLVDVESAVKVTGWEKGVGWGPWGEDDEVGALNAIKDNGKYVAKTLRKMVNEGKVYDLDPGRFPGMFTWPGHPPFLNTTFRTPAGERAQKDWSFTLPEVNPQQEYWISEMTIGSQHTGAHFDSLAHLTTRLYKDKPATDDYWYNGWNATDYLGDFGPMKADVSTSPPVVNRGVLVDVYGYFQSKGKENLLTKGYAITIQDLKETLKWEGVDIKVGDSVLIRTGVLRHWPDAAKVSADDGAGPDMPATEWLVLEKGAIFVASDASAWEQQPAAAGLSFNPAHIFLLIEQGVHIGELFYLEELAADEVYEFAFILSPLKIDGATGSMVRPLAIN